MFIINGEQQPHGSLNRVTIPDGLIKIPGELYGKTAYNLLSTRSIELFHKENCLDFPSIVPESEGFIEFFKTYGRSLAYILYVLKMGYNLNLKRNDWREEEWLYWSKVEHVVIGGGIVNLYWDYFNEELEKVLKEMNVSITLEKHQKPNDMVLYGLKHSSPRSGKCILLDFGGTRIKKMVIDNGNEQTVEYFSTSIVMKNRRPEDMLTFLKNALEPGYDALYISIASYLRNGVPISETGLFGSIGKQVGNLSTYLTKNLNFQGEIKVFHDASIAANPYRNTLNTVVITLGTAIGVGYT